NDLVLTDIAVSRKHFDLRFENSAWVLVDRGSGNGTLVNGAVEDHPFQLAHGDTIEIGNTQFRFDQPNGVPRQPSVEVAPSARLEARIASQLDDDDGDDDEASTIAGKPLREELITPVQ